MVERGKLKDEPISKLTGLITLSRTDGAREAYEIAVQPSQNVAEITPAAAASGPPGGGLGLWQAAAFAFLGGADPELLPLRVPRVVDEGAEPGARG